jgi:hypothetical protein
MRGAERLVARCRAGMISSCTVSPRGPSRKLEEDTSDWVHSEEEDRNDALRSNADALAREPLQSCCTKYSRDNAGRIQRSILRSTRFSSSTVYAGADVGPEGTSPFRAGS